MRLSNNLWSIDIETVSQGKRADDFTASSDDDVKVGNLKDPEKIKAKIEEAKIKAKSQHGLYWWTGKIVCACLVNVADTSKRYAIANIDEVEALAELAMRLNGSEELVSMNGNNFDYGFIVGRYLANNIPVPRALRGQNKFDILDLFGRSQACSQRTSLANIAHGICIDGKKMKGNQVQSLYDQIIMAQGDDRATLMSSLVEYCIQDCMIVAEVVRRYYGSSAIESLAAARSHITTDDIPW